MEPESQPCLSVITGQQLPSEGTVSKPKESTLGYLTQDILIDSEESVLKYVLESNPILTNLQKDIDAINSQLVTREDYESDSYLELLNHLDEYNHKWIVHEGPQWEEKVVSVLNGLGFANDVLEKSLNTFSGGWKMRGELARNIGKSTGCLVIR